MLHGQKKFEINSTSKDENLKSHIIICNVLRTFIPKTDVETNKYLLNKLCKFLG